jgi:hypothetical protein
MIGSFRGDDRLVVRDPARDPIAEALEADGRVLREVLHCVAPVPAAAVL